MKGCAPIITKSSDKLTTFCKTRQIENASSCPGRASRTMTVHGWGRFLVWRLHSPSTRLDNCSIINKLLQQSKETLNFNLWTVIDLCYYCLLLTFDKTRMAEAVQDRIYRLLEELQKMANELPRLEILARFTHLPLLTISPVWIMFPVQAFFCCDH